MLTGRHGKVKCLLRQGKAKVVKKCPIFSTSEVSIIAGLLFFYPPCISYKIKIWAINR